MQMIIKLSMSEYGYQYYHVLHIQWRRKGWVRAPQLSRMGGRAPPKYMCVTSSTSREQYCLSGTYA